jgi:hypothetical protein
MYHALKNDLSVIRVLQEEVYNDSSDWKTYLSNNIRPYTTAQVVYPYEDTIYDSHQSIFRYIPVVLDGPMKRKISILNTHIEEEKDYHYISVKKGSSTSKICKLLEWEETNMYSFLTRLFCEVFYSDIYIEEEKNVYKVYIWNYDSTVFAYKEEG